MRIGNITLTNNIFLAPMAGVTDLPFRLLCKRQGCGLVYTEMVSAKGMQYGNDNTKFLTRTEPKERPVALQLFGSSPTLLAEMAAKCGDYDVDIIDINMGCPAPKIVRNGEGSALMREPVLVGEIIRAVSRASVKPVTVKIRKGFDTGSVNAVEIARIAESSGAVAVTVHGRTRDQYYSGEADWDIIREVKQAVSIPVIGNGDVNNPSDAVEMLSRTGCDAVMIGRGAQGNPWIFSRTLHYIKTGELLPEPDLHEKIEMALLHGQMLIEHKGEYVGIREMRKHAGWYLKGVRDASKLKVAINHVETLEQMKDIFQLLKS